MASGFIKGFANDRNVDVAANHQSHCRTSDPNGTTDSLKHRQEAKQFNNAVGLLLQQILVSQ